MAHELNETLLVLFRFVGAADALLWYLFTVFYFASFGLFGC